MTVVLVTGSRDHDDPSTVFRELNNAHVNGMRSLVVGDCPTGVVHYVRMWANTMGVPYEMVRAEWTRWGKAAGPIRNRRMIDVYKPDACLAFFQPGAGNRGTTDCANYAEAQGVRVLRFEGPNPR